MKPKIVFITNTISQPRVIKRIKSIHEAGFDTVVYGFNRNIYNCNSLPKDINLNVLGSQRNGSDYISKFKSFGNALKDIIKKESINSDVIYYSFSLISSYYLKKAKVKYVYEISDILYGYPKFNFIRQILKRFECNIVNKSICTVMTSEGFKQYLFGNKHKGNIIIQPNKLNQIFSKSERPTSNKIDIEHIRFGFVGAIRYKETVLRFAKIIGKHFKQHEFHFYGDSSIVSSFMDETKEYNNVKFHGPFKNPSDLPQIYNSIDIVVACYETRSLNEKIAEPNKLYESAYFIKPIIVSKNSFLENKVNQLKCGYAINAYEDNDIIEFIMNLNNDDLTYITENESLIPSAELIDNPNAIINALEHE